MHKATFFLSTGRCGTQWLAHWLTEHYADLIEVTHEPLHNNYQSRQLLSTPNAMQSAQVKEHLARIEQILEHRPYVEVGHPCWGAIPHLIKHFRDHIRIVQLVRHPVTTSYSWLTHGAYQPPLLPHIPEKVLLSPFDKGVQFPEYQNGWQCLMPFEKALYFWTELHTLGKRLEKENCAPWLKISYEALFQGNDLNKLTAFLDLPAPLQDLSQAREIVVDKFHYLSNSWSDWTTINRHQHCLKLAEHLGYTLTEINERDLAKRYLGIGSY